MLFILTGSVESGKTRWLSTFIEELSKREFFCAGVLAPGIWKAHESKDFTLSYEKRGITVTLLPQGKDIPFALRRDLLGSPTQETSQSNAAGLRWAIKDSTISQVNQHFKQLHNLALKNSRSDLLVVDEFGRLELEENKGFTQAMKLITEEEEIFPQALVVVRSELLEQAKNKLGKHRSFSVISPNENGRDAVLTELITQKSRCKS